MAPDLGFKGGRYIGDVYVFSPCRDLTISIAPPRFSNPNLIITAYNFNRGSNAICSYEAEDNLMALALVHHIIDTHGGNHDGGPEALRTHCTAGEAVE